MLNAALAAVWTSSAESFAVVATFGTSAESYVGVESAFYNAMGANGQWLLVPVVVVRGGAAAGRCLHLVSANRSASSPYAEGVEIPGSCPSARLPAWAPGPAALGYLAYASWDGGGDMRAMVGRTDGHGLDFPEGVFEHASPGGFPRIGIDDAQRAWMGVQLPDGSMDFEFAISTGRPS